MTANPSPRDRFITVYGRKPVLEALDDETIVLDKIVLAENASGEVAREILARAARRGVVVQRASAQRVKLLAGNGRHDQGVVADIDAVHMLPLDRYLATAGERSRDHVLLLDGVTTPANVGMILRTATAADLDGIVVPHRGVASLDPLVVKASAGIALRSPVVRSSTALDAAQAFAGAGYPLFGLDASAGRDVFSTALPDRAVFVLGGESGGVSGAVAALVTEWLAIPMARGVESLNVASAATVLCFELARRRHGEREPGAASSRRSAR